MARLYEVIIRAQISLTGHFTADTAADAVTAAKAELISSGQIVDVVVERMLLIDDD